MHTRSQHSCNVCTGCHVLRNRCGWRKEDGTERDRGFTSWTYIFCNLQLEWSTRHAPRKTQLHHKGNLTRHMCMHVAQYILYVGIISKYSSLNGWMTHFIQIDKMVRTKKIRTITIYCRDHVFIYYYKYFFVKSLIFFSFYVRIFFIIDRLQKRRKIEIKYF